jgi:hypothetical protein
VARRDHLAIYESAGFTGLQADQAAATVFTFVLGNALGPAADASVTRKLSRDGGDAEELMREHMAKAREIARQFPRLRARVDTAAAITVRRPRTASTSASRPSSTACKINLSPTACSLGDRRARRAHL